VLRPHVPPIRKMRSPSKPQDIAERSLVNPPTVRSVDRDTDIEQLAGTLSGIVEERES